MASTAVAGEVLDGSNPTVARLRQLISGRPDAKDGWSRCWNEGVTPWDLGQPTPAAVELVKSGTLPGDAATVLVPGCGAGYDVVALSGAGRFVVGLDICETAIQKAKQWSSAADGSFFTFVAADFFTWEPPEKFDIIFDYTYEDDHHSSNSFLRFMFVSRVVDDVCSRVAYRPSSRFFCALDPSLRQAWAKRMSELLKPDGELITLMYLAEGQESGPPFNTTVLDIQDNEVAVEPRKGMEKIARWKRMAQPVESAF
ncbi:hypothetical protein PR202_ga14133 [Eleusine coracana subsp. coracana]|uniref:Thiol methyltransferase 2 n=1 Tax=Eleusine coracana subsp. coracana TaxID=191504 RepID=A0AAV5CFT1_ELECO|nr:hypothetical protein PR202_ga14133 [Eleusine coracana subsp. coracana]